MQSQPTLPEPGIGLVMLRKKSNFYGEFVITHNWNNSVPIYCKLLVAGAVNGGTRPSFYIKELTQTYAGCALGNTYAKIK